MASTVGTRERLPAGCSKRPFSKAAGESKPEAYPRGYVEDFDESRTKLADFFSILLSSRVTGLMPGCPLVGECHGGIPFAKDFCNSVHQFVELLDIFWGKVLSESRVQPPPSFHFFSDDGCHHAHQLDFG